MAMDANGAEADRLDPWDRALLDALDTPDDEGTLLTLHELAEHSGMSLPLLQALAREGLLVPRADEPQPLYAPSDAEALTAGMTLVGEGLPLAELLNLARSMDHAMRPIATEAVDVFSRFVRDSVEANAGSDGAAAQRLVEAFRTMLPATGRLVDHHFRRLLVAEARRRMAAEGDETSDETSSP